MSYDCGLTNNQTLNFNVNAYPSCVLRNSTRSVVGGSNDSLQYWDIDQRRVIDSMIDDSKSGFSDEHCINKVTYIMLAACSDNRLPVD